MRPGRVNTKLPLTKEQDAMRLRGLRILARMIVRAHMSSLIDDAAGMNGSFEDTSHLSSLGRERPRKDVQSDW